MMIMVPSVLKLPSVLMVPLLLNSALIVKVKDRGIVSISPAGRV